MAEDGPNARRNHVDEVRRRNNWRIHLVILVDGALFRDVLNCFRAQKFVQSAAVEEGIFGAFNENAAVVVCSDAIEPRRDFGAPAGHKCVALGVDFPTHARPQRIVTPIRI